MALLVRKMSQALGWFVVLSMLFFILSVSSYSPDDPAGNHYVSSHHYAVHNLGGTAGAILADWTLQALGCAVFLLVGIVVLSAWWLLLGRVAAAVAVCWRGFICLVAGSACAYLTFVSDPIWGTTMVAGGIIGQWLAENLVILLQNLLAGLQHSRLVGPEIAAGLIVHVPRPGAYAILGLAIGGAFYIGVDYPRLAALWRGLKHLGHQGIARARRVREEAVVEETTAEDAVLYEADFRRPRPRRARARAMPVPSDTVSPDNAAEDVEPSPRPADVRMSVAYGAVVPSVPSADPRTVGTVAEAARTVPLAPPSPVEARPVSSSATAARPIASGVSEMPPPPLSPPPAQILGPSVPATRTTGRRRPLAVPQLPSLAVASASAVPEAPAYRTPPPARRVRRQEPPVVEAPQPPTVSLPPSSPSTPVRPSSGSDCLPSLELLEVHVSSQSTHSAEELDIQARVLEQKLREFGVEGEVVRVRPGPVITMYEFAPAAGVKVSKIVNLQDDLALVMEAVSVRVVAPIPGKAAVGIEIPHKRRETVRLRDLLDSEPWRTSPSRLSLALGKDTLGYPVVIDLALIPHLLIAGATGSGKSVGLNSLICSLLFRATPADVKMIMIDPKMLEFSVYDGIPHLLVPVVTEPKKAAVVLRRMVEEMGRRYQMLAAAGVRSIAQYNQRLDEAQQRGAGSRTQALGEKLPYLVVIIDELSDLMMVSAREVEDSLMRLAQMARAAGIHLIVATQRPSVDVLTGVIKANFPARVSFQVASKVDSRTILDTNGAETLLGRGDMLFLAPGSSKPQRIHGAYVSEAEMSRLVEAWKHVEPPCYDETFLTPESDQVSIADDEYDEKYDEAVALVAKTGQASISMLQRRLRVGYNRAARMIEMMEKVGVVGPADGMKPREVLIRNTFDAT